MIAALAEAALRSFALGGVVWIGLTLFRVRNPHVHMTAWVVVLLASLAMRFVMRLLDRYLHTDPKLATVTSSRPRICAPC